MKIILLIGMVLVTACSSPETTPLPTEIPTAAPSATSTIIWFPPTETPLPIPSVEPSPTVDLRPGQGEIIFQDDFSNAGDWSLVRGYAGSATVVNGRLTLALSEAEQFLFATRQAPVFGDFYFEIIASPNLCQGADEYGVLIRVSAALEYYRFSLSCDGRARVDRFFNGNVSTVAPWISNGVIPTTVPNSVRIGVWALDGEIRFFVDNQFLFSVQDKLLYTGTIGAFVRTAGATPVTVSFSDLVVRNLLR